MRTLLTNSGTGKIYASALAMRELGFKRVLFLVHRVTLAKQAKKSFEKVFDKKVTMGLVGARNARKEDNRGNNFEVISFCSYLKIKFFISITFYCNDISSMKYS